MARHFLLNTGNRMPSVGLGTWQADPGVVGAAVYAAVKAGYRHIDCASEYGNEKEIGLALKTLFEEGIVKREDLFITSKLWNDRHAPEDVPEALNESLNDLQLDYLDLYLAYSPLGSPGTTWMNGNVLKEPVIISIAEKLGKTTGQVALLWNIQMGHSVLPKSTNQERIKKNLDVYDWAIQDDVLAKFTEIQQVTLAIL
ncbi:unnamed protein product [Triticum turgidum subsp. durum]|uniref:NADP-dependent oxidoreductase domain-containing protein n=1 Tax=Triticum turgidum subsp. durum TaxID=4567 RepID=A0A9R0QMJ3_TRITD|nr:unnamed protein product [Triticum turgidum subsp. durum]